MDEEVHPAVQAVMFAVGMLRGDDPTVEDPAALLGLFVAPGRVEYFQNPTDDQLRRLRNISRYGAAVQIGDNLVSVALAPRHAEVLGHQNTRWNLTAADEEAMAVEVRWTHATVRFFPELQLWLIERVGELGPPRLEVLG